MEGFLLFDKPVGWTNKSIIGFLKRTLGVPKLGHAGTLDPFADGLMVVGIGRAYTRLLHTLLTESRKEYIATLELGKVSDTFDPVGVITSTGNIARPTPDAIRNAIETHLLGDRIQVPPVYSAKKFSGKRLRDMATKEDAHALASTRAKNVTLHEYEVVSYAYPFLVLRLAVSSGYYIRTFGNSLGELLGTGAYCKALRRTRINNHSVDDALTPDDLAGTIEVQGTLTGTVQAVGYRLYATEVARRYSIAGTVQNLPDGSLSFLAQGPLHDISLFLKHIRQGPPLARVDSHLFLIRKPRHPFVGFTAQ